MLSYVQALPTQLYLMEKYNIVPVSYLLYTIWHSVPPIGQSQYHLFAYMMKWL